MQGTQSAEAGAERVMEAAKLNTTQGADKRAETATDKRTRTGQAKEDTPKDPCSPVRPPRPPPPPGLFDPASVLRPPSLSASGGAGQPLSGTTALGLGLGFGRQWRHCYVDP